LDSVLDCQESKNNYRSLEKNYRHGRASLDTEEKNLLENSMKNPQKKDYLGKYNKILYEKEIFNRNNRNVFERNDTAKDTKNSVDPSEKDFLSKIKRHSLEKSDRDSINNSNRVLFEKKERNMRGS
jgi:hypothetical protein